MRITYTKPDLTPQQAWENDVHRWMGKPEPFSEGLDDEGFYGACDVCDRQDVPLNHCWAYGIETFYCEECGS